MIHKIVRFNGQEYWYHDDEDGSNVLLSPIDHFSEDGELLADPFTAVSFAVIEDNDIMRFHRKIGNISDLEDIK